MSHNEKKVGDSLSQLLALKQRIEQLSQELEATQKQFQTQIADLQSGGELPDEVIKLIQSIEDDSQKLTKSKPPQPSLSTAVNSTNAVASPSSAATSRLPVDVAAQFNSSQLDKGTRPIAERRRLVTLQALQDADSVCRYNDIVHAFSANGETIKRSTVGTILLRLTEKGYVERVTDGQYKIAEAGRVYLSNHLKQC